MRSEKLTAVFVNRNDDVVFCSRNVKSDAHGARMPRERSGRALRTEQSRREAGKSYEEGNTEDDDTGDCIESDGCTNGNGNGEL